MTPISFKCDGGKLYRGCGVIDLISLILAGLGAVNDTEPEKIL